MFFWLDTVNLFKSSLMPLKIDFLSSINGADYPVIFKCGDGKSFHQRIPRDNYVIFRFETRSVGYSDDFPDGHAIKERKLGFKTYTVQGFGY